MLRNEVDSMSKAPPLSVTWFDKKTSSAQMANDSVETERTPARCALLLWYELF
jgi:hypothetical protein